MPKGRGKATVHDVMHKFKAGTLHSGRKKGPMVKSRKQAMAIAMSEAGRSRGKSKSKGKKRPKTARKKR